LARLLQYLYPIYASVYCDFLAVRKYRQRPLY
jgi:hypothetical protein